MFIIFAGCWNMHCFSQPSSAAGSLCLFDSFFFPPRKNKTTFVQIKLSNVSFILGGVYKDVLPWHCLFWLPLRFFCHNTHNSSGLTCCSFPLTCFPPFSKPMGLMAQDLSLLPPLVVRLQRLFFFLFLLLLYYVVLPFLCCSHQHFLHVHLNGNLSSSTLAEACWDFKAQTGLWSCPAHCFLGVCVSAPVVVPVFILKVCFFSAVTEWLQVVCVQRRSGKMLV